jgi:hypothetical protein
MLELRQEQRLVLNIHDKGDWACDAQNESCACGREECRTVVRTGW